MTANESVSDPDLLQQIDVFIGAVMVTQAVVQFLDARHRFETDAEVQMLRERLRERAEAFGRAQQAGNATSEAVREVRTAQANVLAHPIVREFAEARDAVATLLQETNRVISETLGVDFGRTAGPGGGGCG